MSLAEFESYGYEDIIKDIIDLHQEKYSKIEAFVGIFIPNPGKQQLFGPYYNENFIK